MCPFWFRWFDAKNLFRFAWCICMVCAATIIVGEEAQAQFRILRTFDQHDFPVGKPLIIGSQLYGTFGQNDNGTGVDTLFRMNFDGTGYEVLHTFEQDQWEEFGFGPSGELAFDGSRIYGANFRGGNQGGGTLYSYDLATQQVQTVHQFTAADDAPPGIGVAIEGSKLYGVAENTVFRIETDGSSFEPLRTFSFAGDGVGINNLVVSNGYVYGTLYNSTQNDGSIFSMRTDGADYKTLHEFHKSEPPMGSFPEFAPLFLDGTTLYGTTLGYPGDDWGSAFKIEIDGSGYENLHQFGLVDGAYARSLVRVGDKLVGLTLFGWPFGGGNLFTMDLDGSNFELVHGFPPTVTGTNPALTLGLTAHGDTVYGFRTFSSAVYAPTLFAYTVPEPSTFLLMVLSLSAIYKSAAKRQRQN